MAPQAREALLVESATIAHERPPATLVGLRFLTLVVAILAATQYVYGVFEHSSLISIQFATSVLGVCSAIELMTSRMKVKDDRSVYLLFRTAGTVFFIASLFLNLTHCLENLSDLNPHSTSEHLNETSKEPHDHNHGIAHLTLYISIADLVVKTLFAVCHNSLSISFMLNFIAMVPPSALSIFVYFHNKREWNFFFGWLNDHLEPVTAILMTVTCLAIAIYSLYKKKQYLLAEGPKGFSIDEISNTVKAKNASLDKVDHVHASCEWPEGFTVSLKAYIKVQKSNKDWVAQAASNFSELKTLLHSEIKAQGAKEVIVEPVFVDQGLENYVEPICIDKSCHKEDVGCCTIPKSTEEA